MEHIVEVLQFRWQFKLVGDFTLALEDTERANVARSKLASYMEPLHSLERHGSDESDDEELQPEREKMRAKATISCTPHRFFREDDLGEDAKLLTVFDLSGAVQKSGDSSAIGELGFGQRGGDRERENERE